MGYEFRLVDISIFDFHLAIAPLMAANSTQPDFAFLLDENSYNTKYTSGEEIETANFKFKALSRRMINHHRFWRHYHVIRQSGGQPNFWNVQMPFTGKPTKTRIELVPPANDFTAEVWPTILLTAMGWSTNLKIRLRGKITPKQLREFINQLGDENHPPFKLDDELMTRQEVLMSFAQQMKKEVYTPQLNESTKINRYTIVSLSRYSGEIYSYQGTRKGVKLMTAGDRADLHSILLGRKVEALELIKMEGRDQTNGELPKRKGFLLTLFPNDRGGGTDFAITHFERGTLIFMQQIASEEGNRWRDDPQKWRRWLNNLQCHTANVRHYLMMTLAMLEFYNDTKDVAATNTAIKSLRDNIRKTLIKLPSKYTNRFCQSFHKYYGRLKDFQPDESPVGAARRENLRW